VDFAADDVFCLLVSAVAQASFSQSCWLMGRCAAAATAAAAAAAAAHYLAAHVVTAGSASSTAATSRQQQGGASSGIFGSVAGNISNAAELYELINGCPSTTCLVALDALFTMSVTCYLHVELCCFCWLVLYGRAHP
jgi:uncharacterized membrane protein YeiB